MQQGGHVRQVSLHSLIKAAHDYSNTVIVVELVKITVHLTLASVQRNTGDDLLENRYISATDLETRHLCLGPSKTNTTSKF